MRRTIAVALLLLVLGLSTGCNKSRSRNLAQPEASLQVSAITQPVTPAGPNPKPFLFRGVRSGTSKRDVLAKIPMRCIVIDAGSTTCVSDGDGSIYLQVFFYHDRYWGFDLDDFSARWQSPATSHAKRKALDAQLRESFGNPYRHLNYIPMSQGAFTGREDYFHSDHELAAFAIAEDGATTLRYADYSLNEVGHLSPSNMQHFQ